MNVRGKKEDRKLENQNGDPALVSSDASENEAPAQQSSSDGRSEMAVATQLAAKKVLKRFSYDD